MTVRRTLPVLVPLLLAGCATAPSSETRGEAGGFPDRIAGLGTEPFWNIAVAGAALRYTSADTPAPRSAPVTRHLANGVLELNGTFSGLPLRALIRRAPCSDGMSDRRYPFALALTIEGRQLAGCAYDAATPPPAE